MKKITKKLTLILGAVFMMVLPLLTVAPTYAEYVNTATPSCPETSGETGRSFLGIKPWYDGLLDSKGNVVTPIEDEKNSQTACFVWTAVANVTSSISSIAAILAIGFVIYGGYLYIFSGGDAAKTAAGRKTLYAAFIGLAVVVLANVIFSTIRIVLTSSSSGTANDDGLMNVTTGSLINDLVQWFVGIAGMISAIFLVYGSISYITSNGDSGKIAKAKNCIIYALIGMAIVGASEIIVSFYMSTINSSDTSLLNDITTIAKGGL